MSAKRLEIFLILFLFLGACAQTLENYPSLVNKGILPLSASNAYLGTNLFLSDEFQRSTDLFFFLKSRGAPLAIEVMEGAHRAPTMRMFYTKEREFYIAETQDDNGSRNWVIRGPFAISRSDYRHLPKRDIDTMQEPVFTYHGNNSFRFRQIEEISKPLVAMETPIIPKAKPAKPKTKKKKWVQVATTAKASETTTSSAPAPETKVSEASQPLNFDQQALQISKGFAERGPNGDIIHTVKKQGATVEALTKWYTGSTLNAEKIAQINGVKVSDKLSIGKRISVPAILVREFRAMPEN